MKELIQFERTVTVELVQMQCGECSIHFAMDSVKYDRCKKTGENWYCPNGHGRIFTKSKVKELQEQLAAANQSKDYLIRAKNNLHEELLQQKHKTRAEKAAKTRVLNRVHAGVCTCCNRTFQNLKRHMETKHPKKPIEN